MAKAPVGPDPASVHALINSKGLLQVHVTPNARHSVVLLPNADAAPVLQVRTTATPEDGKATQDVIRLVAAALGIAKSAVTLERGATTRDKTLKIDRKWNQAASPYRKA